MTLLFCEGFDQYADKTEMSDTWTFSAGPGSTTYSLVTGRPSAGQGVLINSDFSSINTSAISNNSSFIIGFAIKSNSGIPTTSLEQVLIITTGSGTVIGTVFITVSGQLTYTRSVGNTLGTTTASINSSDWTYVELKVFIDNSVGTVDIQFNGTNVLSLTGQDTEPSIASIAATYTFVGNLEFDPIFDDVYIADTAGTINNDFLGDSKVEYLAPDGVGGTTQWTIGGDTPAATNWESVDDANPGSDGTTTVVESSTAANIDLYTFGNLASSSATIHGVQVGVHARKEGIGGGSLKLKCDDQTTVQDGADIGLSTTFTHYNSMFESRDGASTAWTGTLVDGADFGIEVV